MTKHDDVLISLKPKHAACIFAGTKTVELRKRRPNIRPGTSVWIYATAPVATLGGYATLKRIESDSPAAIWEKFGAAAGISKVEFDEYFLHRKKAHAIVLGGVNILRNPVALNRMKEMVHGFHPPQFFCRLNGAVADMRLRSRKSQRLES
jgi:predicted transcriptional regulator